MHIKDFDPYDFSKKNIDGVNVYYKNLPWAPCINIYTVFNVGAFSDPDGKEGLSHFLEHMIFDGSAKFKDKNAIREWSKKYSLNSWNAWTSYYQTAYHLRCLPENYKHALVGMKDMIFQPLLKEKDIEHERGVITQEIWRRYKNEKYLKYMREVLNNTYQNHNLSRVGSALGWPETVAQISQDDVKKWHLAKYTKENLCIVLTGAIEEGDIEELKDFIKDIPVSLFSKYIKGEVRKPKILKILKNSDEIGDPNKQAEITISRSLSFLSLQKVQIANLFRSLASDLLNDKLRFEKGLCYSVFVSVSLFTDFSQIFMNIKTEEKNIDIVQEEFWKIINEIESGKYKEKFKVIKKVAIDQAKSSELMSDSIASNAVRDLGKYDNQIIPLFKELRDMEKVTYKNVADFTKEIFDRGWTFTEIILPSKK